MGRFLWSKKLSTFQIIILGFLIAILLGALLLMLPISSEEKQWTAFENALFTATSAVCVTGLVVKDTALYWSVFGEIVIMLLIQIGGLGVISVVAFIAALSGRKISLLQRTLLQDSISAHHISGMVKMTSFIFKVAFITELAGGLVMMPVFCTKYGIEGIWMSFFHSVSAFCNAGFDLMGDKSGAFSSLSCFKSDPGIVIPVCILIITGGIGFLTWDDIYVHRSHIKKYRMQSKVILATTLVLVLLPMIMMFNHDFANYPLKERVWLSFFQTVTPRTAGFNTAEISAMTEAGQIMIIILMLIGGSPGSTAGGMKTTTAAVLIANTFAVFRRKKNAQLFNRRIEDSTVKNAATLLVMYLFLVLTGTFIISTIEELPARECLFETASAIGTVGLSLGITPSLGTVSHMILIALMFFGRAGGLTLMFAALSSRNTEVAQYPVEKIIVG